MKILLNDLYLDCTYSKEVSIERRFFIGIEIDSKKQDVLTFMSEMNSLFEKYNKLENILILDTNNLLKEYEEEDKKNDRSQSNKEFLLLSDKAVYNSLKKIITSKIDSLDENDWITFCKKRYAINKVEFNESIELKELSKFHKSNSIIKELWSNFPENILNFSYGGDREKADTIPERFSQFLKEIQYYHLENKFPEQGLSEKKSKI